MLVDGRKVFKNPSEVNGKIYTLRSSADAIITVKENPNINWTEVYINHDLQDGTFANDTAMSLISYICEEAEKGEPLPIQVIYLFNTDEDKLMQMQHPLKYYGYNVEVIDASQVVKDPLDS
jgi:hypothetical protein